MTGDDTDKKPEDDASSSDATDATDENVVLESAEEGFADTIVAANVDALVAKMDETDIDEAARQRETRKRLEELDEQKSKDLDGTFNFNLDDDL
jgi:hypothetical protein